MPWATAWDNIYLPLRLEGASRRAAAPKIEAALAMVGLSGFARAYPRELSGGMKMRVSTSARARHRAAHPADGRAVRRARRDHPLPAQ